MEIDNQFSAIANLIAEPVRATMLWNLLDGKAYTATELAVVSNISAQSASNHLTKLVEADFLKVEKQGKHRYYSFAKAEVAYAIEAIAGLMPDKTTVKQNKTYVNGDIQFCRTCYDHLAGKIAVDLTQSLLKQKILILNETEFTLSLKGELWFAKMGIDLNKTRQNKRHFAKPCLDWTERKYHLGGSLGAALLVQLKKLKWVQSKANSRITLLNPKGEKELIKMGIKSLTL